jgi:probable rRNA maturation factor
MALRLLGLQRSELSILFVNDRRMRILNRQFRGVDRTTDVLSFPQQEPYRLQVTSYKLKNKKDLQLNSSLLTRHSSLILGDIVVSLQRCKKQAREHGLTFDEELRRTAVHGLLHLAGYDHEKGIYQKSKMESKERELLKGLRYL